MNQSGKEFVYVLPDANGGVASVVRNLLSYGNKEIYTKVILLRDVQANNYITYQFRCNEQCVISYSAKDSKYTVCKKIARLLTSNSVLISNDGNFDLETIKRFNWDIPVVYILHGNLKHYYRILEKYASVIDKVICVSSYLAHIVQSKYNDKNAICIFFPTPVLESVYAIERYDEATTNIVYTGRLEEAKGADFFPEFVRQLDAHTIDYHFQMVGSGDLSAMLKEKIGNHSNVQLLGQLDNAEVMQIHQKNHIFILFSKNEGLPVCIIEAMKAGVIPIVFDLPTGIPDVVQDGKNGYIVAQGDVAACVEHIMELHTNRTLMKELSFSAKKYADAHFDPYVQTQKYEHAFLTTLCSHVFPLKSRFTWDEQLSFYLPEVVYYQLKKLKKTLKWKRQ